MVTVQYYMSIRPCDSADNRKQPDVVDNGKLRQCLLHILGVWCERFSRHPYKMKYVGSSPTAPTSFHKLVLIITLNCQMGYL